MPNQIYLDNHATTPIDERVLRVMLPFFTQSFGNPSSVDHAFGNEALVAVSQAREQVAKVIGAFPEEIIFTSGATEADNLAILGAARKLKNRGNHIITSPTEHKAVLETCKTLEGEGFDVTYLPIDKEGQINLIALEKAINSKTILISIMAANNEIGTIAPLKEIGRIARKHGILFHTDAAQAFGHIPIDVRDMNIDLMSISGHKIYGPKGVGALFIRQEHPVVKLTPLFYGGGQERAIRPGTLNVPGIVGLGMAAEFANTEMQVTAKKMARLRDRLLQGIAAEVPIEVNGSSHHKLPHNLNLFFPNIEAKALINEAKEIAISAGSACTSTEVTPSHVITALGYDAERAYCSVRFGLSKFTTEKEIEKAIASITRAAKKLRSM